MRRRTGARGTETQHRQRLDPADRRGSPQIRDRPSRQSRRRAVPVPSREGGIISERFTGLPGLRADQRAIARDKARFKVVACGRRWGKTTLGLVMAVSAASDGKQVWWVAPTYGMAFQPWGQMKSALYERWERKLEAERAIFLPGGGSLRVRSAENPDALRGVGLDFVVIDEAAFMAESAWTAALRPALSDRKGRALIISTPRGRNWFWHAYQLGRDTLIRDWRSWQAPTSANKWIGEGEIAAARALLPASLFQQEYEAEFLADGGEVFRGVRSAIETALPPEPIPGHRAVMGVDFGRHQDFTALAVIDADLPALVALDRFTEVGWKVQRDRIAALARRWSAKDILAEANAMGEVNIEALMSEEGLPLRGFTTTAKSKPPLIEALVKAIEDRELKLIGDEVLIQELEAYTFTSSRYGNISYSAPPGGHDDTVMALALAWRAAREGPGLSVGVLEW